IAPGASVVTNSIDGVPRIDPGGFRSCQTTTPATATPATAQKSSPSTMSQRLLIGGERGWAQPDGAREARDSDQGGSSEATQGSDRVRAHAEGRARPRAG